METTKRHVKRKTVRKITKARLDEYLGLVGWYTRFHGAGHWRIYNPYDGMSTFQFTWREEEPDRPLYDLRMDDVLDQYPFGKTSESYVHAGIFWFSLKDCVLEAYSDDNGETWEYVSLCAGKKDEKGNYGAVLLFSPKFESQIKEPTPHTEEN